MLAVIEFYRIVRFFERGTWKGVKGAFTNDLSDAKFPEGVWHWEDGTLTATEDQAIWTNESYDNFELELEFKNAEGTNSGVFVYAEPDKWLTNSVEIQIADDYDPKICGFGRFERTGFSARIFLLLPKKAMQQTAQFDIEILDEESINRVLAPFRGRRVKIVVKEIETNEVPSQLELYERALKIRERFKASKIDPNIDLSALANEVNL